MTKPLLGIIAFILLGFGVACQSEEDEAEEDLAERNLDEHACDEAAAKLAQCCAGVTTATMNCRQRSSEGGCDSRRTTMNVLIPMRDAVHCVLNASCQQLNDQGICDALASARPEMSESSSGDPSSHTDAISVCPSLRTSAPSSSSSGSSGWSPSSSSSSGSSGTVSPSDPTTDEDDGRAKTDRCEGDASTCSMYISQLQCESMGCTWIPK